MNYLQLGRSGLKVSELCLGALTFGRECDEVTSRQILNRFVSAGGNFFDTADSYSEGKSEEILGRWIIGQNRDELVIATKVFYSTGNKPNDRGLNRKHILANVEASLRCLNTEYIDLYQIHCWDNDTPIEETLSTMDTLVHSGKIRYIGVSNFTSWQLQKAIDLCLYTGWERLISLQPLYNLLDRDIECELVPVCLNEGIGILPWSPLRGGWLSGKYRRGMDAPPTCTRVEEAGKVGWSEAWRVYNTERTWTIIDTLCEIAGEAGRTPAQTALNWLIQQPGVTAPIIGARTLAQLEDNLGAVGWSLGTDQIQRLNAISGNPLPYPQSFIASML